MASDCFRFEEFSLDPADRQLRRGQDTVELNARYLDALALLVSEQGRLVTKDRFLDEVWQGVPVTDEALTQCIKTLRRQLGDDASRPRFIETVPKHGYRFIATVEHSNGELELDRNSSPAVNPVRRNILLLGIAGTVGGGIAGLIGGLIYGFAGASQPLAPGMGAASVLLVMMSLTIVVGLMGGAGVAFGIAASDLGPGRSGRWAIGGGAVGGMVVGGLVKLLGLDAFNLLLGRSPGDITGAFEGALMGAAVGFGAWLASRRPGRPALRRSVVTASLAGGIGGLVIALLGGRMMAGSLDLLARNLPGSRLELDQFGRLLGEDGFGLFSRMVTGVLEGALFAGCVVGAMVIARKDLAPRDPGR